MHHWLLYFVIYCLTGCHMVSLNASLVDIFCYLLSYWLPYGVIKCVTGCIIYCLTGCHMLSLNASLVALLIVLLVAIWCH